MFKFGIGFDSNELISSVFYSFHWVILVSVFVQQARKFLSHDKKLKGKILTQHSMQYQD